MGKDGITNILLRGEYDVYRKIYLKHVTELVQPPDENNKKIRKHESFMLYIHKTSLPRLNVHKAEELVTKHSIRDACRS